MPAESRFADAPMPDCLFRLGPVRITWRRLGQGVLVAAIIGLLAIGGRRLEFDHLRTWIESMSTPGFLAAGAVLPLAGLPVSWLHLIAGVKFHVSIGLAVVAMLTLIHDVLAWTLVHILPRRCFARLDPWRRRLRRAGFAEATVLCAIIPGVPYTAQLYLLPLLGVPLRVMIGVGVPIHTMRAVVTLYLGEVTGHPTTARLATIACYYVILFAVSAWVGRKMQRRLAADSDVPE